MGYRANYKVKKENRLKIADAIDNMPECDVRAATVDGDSAWIEVFFLCAEFQVINKVASLVIQLDNE